MESEQKFIIRGTSDPEIKENLTSLIAKEHQKGLEKWENEIKKTPEHQKRIQILNTAIIETMTELGVTNFQEISIDQVHFLENFNHLSSGNEEEVYVCRAGEFFPLKKSLIVDESLTQQVIGEIEEKLDSSFEDLSDEMSEISSNVFSEQFPDEEEDFNNPEHEKWNDTYREERMPSEKRLIKLSEKLGACHVLLHEMLHSASHLSYDAILPDENSDNDAKPIVSYRRSGYHDTSNHFIALNEAITEKLTSEILRLKRKLIVPDKQNEFEKLERLEREGYDTAKEIMQHIVGPGSYQEFIDLLDIIIKQIAYIENKKIDEIWNKIKQGYFTGEMMHLRDIERVFGKGSLRVFANTDRNNVHLAIKYFSSFNTDEKDKIAREILSDVPIEKGKWQNRTGIDE